MCFDFPPDTAKRTSPEVDEPEAEAPEADVSVVDVDPEIVKIAEEKPKETVEVEDVVAVVEEVVEQTNDVVEANIAEEIPEEVEDDVHQATEEEVVTDTDALETFLVEEGNGIDCKFGLPSLKMPQVIGPHQMSQQVGGGNSILVGGHRCGPTGLCRRRGTRRC